MQGLRDYNGTGQPVAEGGQATNGPDDEWTRWNKLVDDGEPWGNLGHPHTHRTDTRALPLVIFSSVLM